MGGDASRLCRSRRLRRRNGRGGALRGGVEAPRYNALVEVGFASGEIPKIPLNLALLKRCSIVGVDWGGEARANLGINGQLLEPLLRALDDGRLQPAPVISRPMASVATALTDQLAGRLVGKLVLTN